MMHKTLHSTDDIHKISVSRKGGKDFTSMEDCVYTTIQRFEEYKDQRKTVTVTAVSTETT